MEQLQLPDVPQATSEPPKDLAIGGGLEGAERFSRELLAWTPRSDSGPMQVWRDKYLADARSQSMAQNMGMVSGAINTQKNSIVGNQYRLNLKPRWELLGVDQGWSDEMQKIVEARFNTIADSPDCFFDASRINTFTELIRLGVGVYLTKGEILATAEWLRQVDRPFSTAIQMLPSERLTNPDNQMDTQTIKSGIEMDLYGRETGFYFRRAYPGEEYIYGDWGWTYVPATKPWGRPLVLHLFEQKTIAQPRGISDMVAALKHMHMTKEYQEVTLQSAVLNASFAAAIESELPQELIYQQMGIDPDGKETNTLVGNYLKQLAAYTGASKNLTVAGAKIPVLFPGTKLTMLPAGTPGGVGTDFEASLLKHIAATFNMSLEEFTHDFSNTNYSSARAAMGETAKHYRVKKKQIADRFANQIFRLWFEEEWNAGNIPLPTGKNRAWFYEPYIKDFICNAEWIGGSTGQVDELKETTAAAMRITSRLSTYEIECAKLGLDWRQVMEQQARESNVMSEYGLTPIDSASTTTAAAASNDSNNSDNSNNTDQQADTGGNQ